MQPEISSNSSHEERPSLGTSIEAVLAGWRREAQAYTAPGQRVRALLTTRQVGEWEFIWQDGAIHRLSSPGESRPATPGEQEMLRRSIAHGWFLVYRLEAGQEPIVLHTVGIEMQDSTSPAAPAPIPLAKPEGESASQEEAGATEESREPGGEAFRHEVPSPASLEGARTRAGKRLLPHGLALLLLGGAVAGSGAIGWLLTHRSELAVVIAALVLALVLLGRSIKSTTR